MTDIPWGALRSLTAGEIISALIRDGLSLPNQRGSHQRYRSRRSYSRVKPAAWSFRKSAMLVGVSPVSLR